MASIVAYTTQQGKVRYRCFVARTVKGRLVRQTKVFTTKRAAERWRDEQASLKAAEEAARKAAGRRYRLSELIQRYMEGDPKPDGWTPENDNRAYKGYAGRDDSHGYRLAWWTKELGDARLSEIDGDMIKGSLDKLITEKSRGPASRNRYLTSLSSVFRVALEQRWPGVSGNPCHGVGNLTEPQGRERFLTDAERTALLEAAKKSPWDRLYLLVAMALSTGARKGEILDLRWRPDPEGKHAYVELAAGVAHLSRTKNGSRRRLPLVPAVIAELERFRKLRDLRTDRVFPGHVKPADKCNIDRHWWAALKAAGIERFRFHDLRHTCASTLAMNGASLVEIGDLLGHASLQTTRRYSHLSIEHKTQLVNRVLADKV